MDFPSQAEALQYNAALALANLAQHPPNRVLMNEMGLMSALIKLASATHNPQTTKNAVSVVS